MAKYITCHRRGTAEDWAAYSTLIPLEGEIVIEIDEVNSLHRLKIGDGVTPYSELKYLQAGDEIISQVIPRVITVTIGAEWTEVKCGTGTYYTQDVALDNITEHSRLDLQPDAAILMEIEGLGIVFVTENVASEDGERKIVINSVGNKTTKEYTMQATIVETEVEIDSDVVTGIPVGALRGEITSTNVTNALGYIPLNADSAYTHPTSHPASMITGLADVATSGSYNDLFDQPTIQATDDGDGNVVLTIGG